MTSRLMWIITADDGALLVFGVSLSSDLAQSKTSRERGYYANASTLLSCSVRRTYTPIFTRTLCLLPDRDERRENPESVPCNCSPLFALTRGRTETLG